MDTIIRLALAVTVCLLAGCGHGQLGAPQADPDTVQQELKATEEVMLKQQQLETAAKS